MTMTVAPIPPMNPITPVIGTTGTAPTNATTGEGFGNAVGSALDNLADANAKVDQLAVQAATGDLTAVHDLTVAVTEAQLLTELTVEVRNRAIESFNDIMHMQV